MYDSILFVLFVLLIRLLSSKAGLSKYIEKVFGAELLIDDPIEETSPESIPPLKKYPIGTSLFH